MKEEKSCINWSNVYTCVLFCLLKEEWCVFVRFCVFS